MAPPVRRESTIAPTTPSSAVSGAARAWVRPYTLAHAPRRSGRPPPAGAAVGPPSAGSSRSPAGRSVVWFGTPGCELTRRASRRLRPASPPDHDDVVGARRLAKLLDDGVDDRIRRRPIATTPTGCGRRTPPRSRLRASSAPTAEAWSSAPTPATTTATSRIQSSGSVPPPRTRPTATGRSGGRRRRRATRPGGCVRSDGSAGRAGRKGGWLTSGIEDGGPGPSRPLPRDGTDGGAGLVLPF